MNAKLLRNFKIIHQPIPWRGISKALAVFPLLWSGFASDVSAQTNVMLLDYEWADSVGGPWSKPSTGEAYYYPNGSIVTIADATQKLYRINLQSVDPSNLARPQVPVAQLRRETVDIALNHLSWARDLAAGNTNTVLPEETGWSRARLAPVAFQVFDLAFEEGLKPAYVEFKVISDPQPETASSEFLSGNERQPTRDLGYILVALHEGDAPVPEFSEEGSTPCEELLQRVGNVSKIKIMKFGSTFATVENERGELLANAGTDPFKVPHDYIKHLDQSFQGEFDSENADAPPADGTGGPRMLRVEYESYTDFKTDYLSNPVYQAIRDRRALRAEAEWKLARGESLPQPEVLRAVVGNRTPVLEGQTILRYFLDDDEDEDRPLAVINPGRAGGLAITGGREGSAPLTVKTSRGVTHYELRVERLTGTPGSQEAPSDRDFQIGWQSPKIWSVAGGYSKQPRYWQVSRSQWCPKVGCGPVAWAILCAWWDRNGVPAAFFDTLGDMTKVDAPFYLNANDNYSDFLHVVKVYDKLHDYCDVICFPTGSAGATPPGDMIEAGATYLWIPRILGFLGYSYSWAWDLADPDWNEPSNRIRKAVKKGRPAIVGLGWLWHYGVAYAYRYQEFKVHPNLGPLFVRRWFRVNEGWGKSSGAWYSGGDTFLGASIKAWQKNP